MIYLSFILAHPIKRCSSSTIICFEWTKMISWVGVPEVGFTSARRKDEIVIKSAQFETPIFSQNALKYIY